MIEDYAGDPVPGGWPQAGGRALYLAAEMAGLATGAWLPSPDPASPDPTPPDPASLDPASLDPGRPAPARLPRVATRTLSADAGSVHAARDFTVATLRRWGTAERSQDIALVVSELLTNALRHALPGSAGDSRPTWPIRLGLLQPGSCVLCAVADPSRTAPVLQARGALAETGRGLHLICALSDQWGFTLSDTGKVVWAMFFPRLNSAGAAIPLAHRAETRRYHPGSTIATTIPAPRQGDLHPARIKNPGMRPTASAPFSPPVGPQHPPQPQGPHPSRLHHDPGDKNRINVSIFSCVDSFRDGSTQNSPHSANHPRK